MKAIYREHNLLNLAYEAMASAPAEESPALLEKSALDEAYTYCDGLTREYSRTFYLASGLLPKPTRQAIRALYAFCRVSDDLVDRAGHGEAAQGRYSWSRAESLEVWRQHTTTIGYDGSDLVALAWNHTRRKYQIPIRYAEQLIDGVALDLGNVAYQTFDDLAHYCYGVACTVGLMSMHIIGYSGPEAIQYAVRLGVALQLTNVLRDVGEDWRAGRLYLPREELDAFGVEERELADGIVTPAWRELMRFQLDRNRKLYAEALPGIRLLHRDGRFAVGAAAELYRAILDDIAAHDYDVFHRRASTGKWGKLRRLPGIWWRVKSSAGSA